MEAKSSKGTNWDSQNSQVEDEDGFQKVVRRNRRIVRNIPNNAGPRASVKGTVQDRRPPSSAQRNQTVDRGPSNNRSNSNRTVREFSRGGGRPVRGTGRPKFEDRGRDSNSNQNRRGRGGASASGNFSSRTGKGNRDDREATDRGFPKSRGSNRGGRGGRDNRGERDRVGSSYTRLNNRQGKNSSGSNNVSVQNGRDGRNNRVDVKRGGGGGGGRTRTAAPFRATNNSRDNRSQKEDYPKNDKGRFSNNRKDLIRGKERDEKTVKKSARVKKERGPVPKFTEDGKHKMTFYLPFNSRYLRAWVDPGNESQTPKRNESGFVKVAFRSSDAEMLQNEEGIVVTNEKWTEDSPSGKKIELVRVLLPSNIRSVYEIQQSGEPAPVARKVKKASFVVDPSLVVA
ncbi:hypothetical protein GpartN1_g6679.t1 [Galdieria partita]|uniref:Uncharacterized protein n=1 Tax=Galdieria partita TaxID=83374 RepID=A0A9C7UTH6_9RHOD|nr:hypothetical protein GpartN1_g6679.t1 [Galdieria partita]